MESKQIPVGKVSSTKKAYQSPVLSVFGDVRRLTGGGGGTTTDAGGGMTKMCWIAEALYGADAPRVVLVRAWLTRHYEHADGWALVVVPLYMRFGQRVAALVRILPFLRQVFRPIFDGAVRRAYGEFAAARFPGRPAR